MKFFFPLLVASSWFFSSCDRSNNATDPNVLKINGSTTVNLPIAEAAEILRSEQGFKILVDTQGGSSGGISMLGEGLVQLGMSSKNLKQKDRDAFPNCDFHVTPIGKDAVALIVSKDVWDSGVKSISRAEMAGIYEGKITNWKELGGADQRIAFFNKEPGRGTWEVFAKWAYQDTKLAPQVSFPEVGGNEETRSKVSSTRGAISQLSASWADGQSIFALALETESGEAIEASHQNIINGSYPMSRPLLLLTNGAPEGHAKTFIDFLLSPAGQDLVRKHNYLPIASPK